MNEVVNTAVQAQPVPAKKAPVKKAPVKSALAVAKPVAKPVTKPASKAVPKAVAVKKPVAAAPAQTKAAAKVKPKKDKLIRDSFTIPESEYNVLADIKKSCLNAAVDVKKSQLIRIAIAQLSSMSVPKLSAALKSLAVVQTGRPKK